MATFVLPPLDFFNISGELLKMQFYNPKSAAVKYCSETEMRCLKRNL